MSEHSNHSRPPRGKGPPRKSPPRKGPPRTGNRPVGAGGGEGSDRPARPARPGGFRPGGGRPGGRPGGPRPGGPRSGGARPGGRRPGGRFQGDRERRDDGRERLQKVMAAAGIDSRRQCEELILAGRVEVDRQVVRELGTTVDPENQEIRVDGQVLRLRQRREYFVINKPRGVICTNSDPAGRTRVIDLLPQMRERLFTVGRLDVESEGLILLTNDGELAHRLAHPRFGVQKIYHVMVAGVPTREELEPLTKGVRLADGWVHAERATVKSEHKQSATLEIVLREGKNREIRRLLARIGHKVMKLKRVSIGGVKVKDLEPGQWRRLSSEEVNWLREAGRGERRESGEEREGRPPRRDGARPEGRPPRRMDGEQGTRPARPPRRVEGEQGARPARPPRRVEGEQGARPARPPRRVEGAQGDRPARPPRSREYVQGDRPARPPRSREYVQGDRPARPPRDRGARDGDGPRPPRRPPTPFDPPLTTGPVGMMADEPGTIKPLPRARKPGKRHKRRVKIGATLRKKRD